jgi:hypothetical protein
MDGSRPAEERPALFPLARPWEKGPPNGLA